MTASARNEPRTRPPRVATVVLVSFALAAALCAATWLRLAEQLTSTCIAAALVLASIPAAVIDFRTRRLPNWCSLAIATAAFTTASATALAGLDLGRLLVPLVAAVIAFGVYVGMGLIGWVGFGDAKFAAALVAAVSLSSGLGALWIVPVAIQGAALLRLAHRAVRRSDAPQPHGPVLVLSAALVLVVGFLFGAGA